MAEAARPPRWWAELARLAAMLLLCTLALQAVFIGRIALMALLDPQSTSFQRSEAWRLLATRQRLDWHQHWVDDSRIAATLKRAVVASEDAAFASHHGLDWEALQKAWERNQRSATRSPRRALPEPGATTTTEGGHRAGGRPKTEPKVVGGSTISQQLAKNLLLSGERTLPRKAQEFVLTLALESLLSKRRMLEIYLNSVEWGEGVFGAEAAARQYARMPAAQLDTATAARLAVMLPAPKRFERNPQSAYILARAQVIAARMPAVVLP